MQESSTLHETSRLATPTGYPLRTIHSQVGGEIAGDPDTTITGINALDLAGPGELAFAESNRHLAQARLSRASALIVPKGFPVLEGRTVLRADNPRLAFAKAMHLFLQPEASRSPGIDPRAAIARDAELGDHVTVREFAVIRSRARIGRETVIESGAHIGEGVSIGAQCFIGPNVVIMRGCRIGHRVIIHGGTVIGADGFGYVWDGERHLKIPQVGRVVIEDDVELGANVCMDRATLGATIIKRGTKIDNLVQIAHNDVIGEHVIMSGQVGLAGSVRVGDRVLFGGQVGVADHITIGDDARIGAKSGVTKDVPRGQTVWWFPARPIEQVKRELAALRLLPELLKERQRQKRNGALTRLMVLHHLPFVRGAFTQGLAPVTKRPLSTRTSDHAPAAGNL